MNWTPPPYFDSQHSGINDVDGCVEKSLCNIVYMLTGFRVSSRALGYLLYRDGKLTTNGSSITDALAYANKYGLVAYDKWPTPDTFDWNSYYSPIPDNLLLDAKFFDLKLIDSDLNKSPIWRQLAFPTPTGSNLHWVAQINNTQYFDSEPGGAVKALNYHGAIMEQGWSISLTKPMQFKTQNYKGELRIVLQADSEQTWEALCKVYGVDPKTINEII